MVKPHYLSEFVTGLSSPSIKAHADSAAPVQHIKLALLQPLANTEMFAACRNPSSRAIRLADGSVCGISNHEYLDIQPLNRAWRQAVKTMALPSEVTFDLTLPTMEGTRPSEDKSITLKGDELICASRPKEDKDTSSKEDESASSSYQLYWESTTPADGALSVVTQDVMTLAITLATMMRMCMKGEICFKLALSEKVGARPQRSAMKLLEKQLSAIAKHKTSGNDGKTEVNTE